MTHLPAFFEQMKNKSLKEDNSLLAITENYFISFLLDLTIHLK